MITTYYIIDKSKVMYLQDARSIVDAKELFDDEHVTKHDVVVPSVPCPICNGTPFPSFPEWLEHKHAKGVKVCRHQMDVTI